jgi:hypothetical protein
MALAQVGTDGAAQCTHLALEGLWLLTQCRCTFAVGSRVSGCSCQPIAWPLMDMAVNVPMCASLMQVMHGVVSSNCMPWTCPSGMLQHQECIACIVFSACRCLLPSIRCRADPKQLPPAEVNRITAQVNTRHTCCTRGSGGAASCWCQLAGCWVERMLHAGTPARLWPIHCVTGCFHS